VLVDVTLDSLLQFPGATEHPAAELLLRQRCEPALDQVQPGGAGRGEMQVIARPLGQPALDGGGLVSSVVVQDQVHVEVRGHGRIDLVEEAPELRGSVPAVAGADDLGSLDVEGSEEGDLHEMFSWREHRHRHFCNGFITHDTRALGSHSQHRNEHLCIIWP